MLDELEVHNLGIIDHAHVEPGAGLTVVTGETGTGKTLLLGALRLIIGETARGDMIGPHGDESRVEGRFVFDDGEVAVARRIGKGRSRAYLDGSMAAAKVVEARLTGRVEIVGQHDHIALTTSAELRGLLDRKVAPALVEDYERAWADLRLVRERVAALGGDRRALERELDLVSYQVDEIENAAFNPGDDVVLDTAVSRLRHSEELEERLGAVRDRIDDVDGTLGVVISELRRAAELDPSLHELVETAEAVAAQMTELVSGGRVAHERLESDPHTLAELEERSAVLADLRRKYGASLDEVLSFAERSAKRRDELIGLLSGAEALEEAQRVAMVRVGEAGDGLLDARRAAGDEISGEAVAHLRQLGFDAPVVRFRLELAEPGPHGADRAFLEFASDERLVAAPVSKIASGGELSRLVLSLRLAAGAGTAGVVAFDEIDTGIGGATALEMGRKLASLATERQVLCVTHLPQVAAFADVHLLVERSGTSASVRRVDGESRLEELSRMLSGLPESVAGREHADELRRIATSATG